MIKFESLKKHKNLPILMLTLVSVGGVFSLFNQPVQNELTGDHQELFSKDEFVPYKLCKVIAYNPEIEIVTLNRCLSKPMHTGPWQEKYYDVSKYDLSTQSVNSLLTRLNGKEATLFMGAKIDDDTYRLYYDEVQSFWD